MQGIKQHNDVGIVAALFMADEMERLRLCGRNVANAARALAAGDQSAAAALERFWRAERLQRGRVEAARARLSRNATRIANDNDGRAPSAVLRFPDARTRPARAG